MKGLQLHVEDLHETTEVVENETNNFDGMQEDHYSRVISLDRGQEDFIDNASIFSDDFPLLLDFPCMSSSSSSSSTPAPIKVMVCSSSTSSSSSSPSATSRALLRSNAEDHNNHQHDPVAALLSTGSIEIAQPSDQGNGNIDGVDYIGAMENFGYMDLLKSNDVFDISFV